MGREAHIRYTRRYMLVRTVIRESANGKGKLEVRQVGKPISCTDFDASLSDGDRYKNIFRGIFFAVQFHLP